jgi:hypothetical protein
MWYRKIWVVQDYVLVQKYIQVNVPWTLVYCLMTTELIFQVLEVFK